MASVIEQALPYTKSSRARIEHLETALLEIERLGIPGDIVECGVWRGGNIIVARNICPSRVCWLYDTFDGMTAPGPEDVTFGGVVAQERICLKTGPWMRASQQEVTKNLLATSCFDSRHLRFIEGDVCETLRLPENLPKQIALLRLDTDWYESTRTEMEVLFPLLSVGGVLVVDDYGHWRGARKAVDEFLVGHPVSAPLMVDYTAMTLVKGA